jgi:hypothetical protein
MFTGWWTNYETITVKLVEPLPAGDHVVAFKYHDSMNGLSYLIAFDWFAFSNSYAGVENKAVWGALAGGAAATDSGLVTMPSGSSIGFSMMNYDSGNGRVAKLRAATACGDGVLTLSVGGVELASYAIAKNSGGEFIDIYCDILDEAQSQAVTGINDVVIAYEGSAPLLIDTYQNVALDRRIIESYDRRFVAQHFSFYDKAVSIKGSLDYTPATESEPSYVTARDGSQSYLALATLQSDRTAPECVVAFKVKSSGLASLSLQRDNNTQPFASVIVPDTCGEWATVSVDISTSAIPNSTNVFPTTLRGLFVNIASLNPDDGGGEVQIESLTMDPQDTAPAFGDYELAYVASAAAPFTADFAATDAEGAKLIYRLAGHVPAGMSIDPDSGVLTWAPGDASEVSGLYVVVSDGINTVLTKPLAIKRAYSLTAEPTADGGVSVSVENNSGGEFSGFAILAVYEGSALVLAKWHPMTLAESMASQISFGSNWADYPPERYRYELFLWDSGYAPVHPAIEIF